VVIGAIWVVDGTLHCTDLLLDTAINGVRRFGYVS